MGQGVVRPPTAPEFYPASELCYFFRFMCDLDLNYLRCCARLGFRRTWSSPAARARFTSGCEVRLLRRLLASSV
jgi:hypothetical protein